MGAGSVNADMAVLKVRSLRRIVPSMSVTTARSCRTSGTGSACQIQYFSEAAIRSTKPSGSHGPDRYRPEGRPVSRIAAGVVFAVIHSPHVLGAAATSRRLREAVRMRVADELITPLTIVCLCLCGSSRFKRTFLETQLEESLAGRVVLSLPVFAAVDGCELSRDELETLVDLQARKLVLAGEILVIDVGGYVGPATADEIEFARTLNKRIRFWSKEHSTVPERRLKPMDVLLDVAEVHEAQGFPIATPPATEVPAELRARASRRPHPVVFCQRSFHFTSFTMMTSVMARAN